MLLQSVIKFGNGLVPIGRDKRKQDLKRRSDCSDLANNYVKSCLFQPQVVALAIALCPTTCKVIASTIFTRFPMTQIEWEGR